jgi:hypothetical protein
MRSNRIRELHKIRSPARFYDSSGKREPCTKPYTWTAELLPVDSLVEKVTSFTCYGVCKPEAMNNVPLFMACYS